MDRFLVQRVGFALLALATLLVVIPILLVIWSLVLDFISFSRDVVIVWKASASSEAAGFTGSLGAGFSSSGLAVVRCSAVGDWTLIFG